MIYGQLLGSSLSFGGGGINMPNKIIANITFRKNINISQNNYSLNFRHLCAIVPKNIGLYFKSSGSMGSDFLFSLIGGEKVYSKSTGSLGAFDFIAAPINKISHTDKLINISKILQKGKHQWH